MTEMIRDGTGNGYLQKVNGNNRAFVNAFSTQENLAATAKGNSFNINTGEITLTDAADTPVIYLKNNESSDLHIISIAVGLGTSTGGSSTEPVRVTVVKNPTAGTIVDNATAVDISSNRNFGSAKTITADIYKGATGNTMTDGTDHILFFQPDFGRLFAGIDEIIPRGKSIGIKIQAPTSNTSLTLYVAIICHLEDSNEV